MLLRQEQQNIRAAYILTFFGIMYFPAASWLFFYQKYLTYPEIALIIGIGSLVGIVFEIPTGAFADIVGRRVAIIISYLLYALAMFIEAYSTTFAFFALCTTIAGISSSLYSGSLEALVYDTLKEDGKEAKYDLVISKIEAYAWLGMFVSALVGGFLYAYNFRAPFLVQGFIMLVSAGIALTLSEPVIDTKKYHLRDIITQNVKGFR